MHRRHLTPEADLRTVEDGTGELVVAGYAAVFNRPSVELTDGRGVRFREVVAAGAFARTLQLNREIAALWNHNPDLVLARVSNQTLALAEDTHGLHATIRLDPGSPWDQHAYSKIAAGTVRQMSIGFQVIRESVDPGQSPPLRTLTEVRLLEVSPVVWPAYRATEISARAALAEEGLDLDALGAALLRARAGLPLRRHERAILEEATDLLQTLLPASDAVAAPASHHAAPAPAAPETIHAAAAARARRLALMTRLIATEG